MPRVIIVGAGISGLALAYRLQQRLPGAEVTILEQNNRPGGVVWTERHDGFQVESGPNGFLDSKLSTLELCRELGLGQELVPASAAARQNRYLFVDGRLRLLPHSFVSFLQSDLLSWRGKFDLLAERWRRRRCHGRDESIAAFARRRAGREVAEVIADAVVTGIYAGDPALLSLRAAFPRLAGLEEQYGSVLKGLARAARQKRAAAVKRGEPSRSSTMWTCRGGLRQLIETLHERLPRAPLLQVTVRGIERAEAGPGWTVFGAGQDRWNADAVVLTCPAYRQAAILADLDAELAERVGGIAYNRVAVVALGYRRADISGNCEGFGYIAPQKFRRDVLGVQWCSSIFPGRAPAGCVLVRALCGGWHRAEVAGWSDERLLDAVRADLRQSMRIAAAPIFQHIIRWDRAIPQYLLGHLERVQWIEARLAQYPGLFLGGNAYRGVALNDCTEQAEILAARLADLL